MTSNLKLLPAQSSWAHCRTAFSTVLDSHSSAGGGSVLVRRCGRSRVVLFLLLVLASTAGLAAEGVRGTGLAETRTNHVTGSGELKLSQAFDKNKDGVLNAAEREQARAAAVARRSTDPKTTTRDGARLLREANEEPIRPGARLSAPEVTGYPQEPLFASGVLRTFFIEFEPGASWEEELAVFHDTDVEVPARVIVDGKKYSDVGVSFRGGASFFKVPAGRKRSLKLAFDLGDPDQRIGNHRTLNLLNGYGDPTWLRTFLYLEIARDFIAAPRAAYVRVVVQGENRGVYLNVQHVNTDFTRDAFRTVKGSRWKASGGDAGEGALRYLGPDPGLYRRHYDLKSKESAQAWADLIELCRVLETTPADQLEKALGPRLDVDGTLKYLAVENVLVNRDGHWNSPGDYGLFQDEQRVFHLIPQDVNDSLGAVAGRNSRGGIDLDPLAGAGEVRKPLLSRLLAVPAWRARYLQLIQTVAERGLDWNRLGPLVNRARALIASEVKNDSRRIYSWSAFENGPSGAMALQSFVEQRRAFLLPHAGLTQRDASSRASTNAATVQ